MTNKLMQSSLIYFDASSPLFCLYKRAATELYNPPKKLKGVGVEREFLLYSPHYKSSYVN